MQGKRLSIGSRATLLAIFTVTVFVTGTYAATEKVLHSFDNNGKDGYAPYAGLIFDKAGNLYGTTSDGGAYRYGTVFELTPKTGGGWTEKVLHSFNDNGTDGYFPEARPIFDKRRQSLWHDLRGWHLWGRDSVRVDAQSGRGLDGEGAA